MAKPFWFQLIKEWRDQGMGQYGVSFPFLTGAIAKQSGSTIDHQFIDDIFNEIIINPVEGFYCEVRWCGNIDEPV